MSGARGGFEIWFVVVFDRRTPRAWWFRYTTFTPAVGAPRWTLWAAAFEAGAPARWGKRFVPADELAVRVEELRAGRCTGHVEVDGRAIAWELVLEGGEGAMRGPVWLDWTPAPTHVTHVRAEARVTGTVRVDDATYAVEARGAMKRLWGTRRVEELFWVYCPALDDGGAFEATGVRVRRGVGPAIAPVWLRAREQEHRWWGVPGLFRNHVAPDGPGRIRVRATAATRTVEAVATCDVATLAGYVYRDPAGWDVHVAQSDVATLDGTLRTRAHRLAPWGAVRRFGGARAAVEFHHPEPLPDTRYVAWDGTAPPEASCTRTT